MQFVRNLVLVLSVIIHGATPYSVPFCFSKGVTWSSTVSGGIPFVETPEECQMICADSGDCRFVTWYDGQAMPHPYYCEMFPEPEPAQEVSCDNCTSGPASCICSGRYTCSLDSDQLVELLFGVTSEIRCAELCFENSDCKYYSWYTPDNHALKEACALLRGCSERTGSETCNSGPSDCSDSEILGANYPLCFSEGLTWIEELTKGIPNITNPYLCQSLCDLDGECTSFTWFSSLATPYNNFCEFYLKEVSKPTDSCNDCVSGRSSCTCSVSNYQACNTNQDLVRDIIQHVESELLCQDRCRAQYDCSWYTWYGEEGIPVQNTCFLLDSCTTKIDCNGCFSGPDNCEDVEMTSVPAMCRDYKELSSFTRNVITPGASLTGICSTSTYCSDDTAATNAPADWFGDSWYRFTGSAGSKIAETATVHHQCGTNYGGYMVGGHPSVEDGEVIRSVYFDNAGDHLDRPVNISVVNCHSFYVYYLLNLSGGKYRSYCGN